jgi:hypothetical protein
MGCTFLITHRYPTVLFEPIDQTLYSLSKTIESSIKRTAAMFISLGRDRDPDAMAPQIGSDFTAAIGLIAHPATRTVLRTPAANSFHGTPGH